MIEWIVWQFVMFSEQWFAWMLPMTWQITVLAVPVYVLTLIFRKSSPRVRYALWCLVLVKLCLPPDLALPVSIGRWIHESASPRLEVSPPESTADAHVSKTDSEPVLLFPSQPAPRFPTQELSFFIVWIAGILVVVWRIRHRSRNLRLTMSHVKPISDPRIHKALDTCRQEVGVHEPVLIRRSESLDTPFLIGMLTPRIVLPEWLCRPEHAAELHPVLLHELMHLKRHDIWVGSFMTILMLAYWFHPLVWLTILGLRREREMIVDDLVASELSDDDRVAYAESLIHATKYAGRLSFLGAGFVGIGEEDSGTKRRVGRMLALSYVPTTRLRPALLAGISLIAVILIPQAAWDRNLDGDVLLRYTPTVPSTMRYTITGSGPRDIVETVLHRDGTDYVVRREVRNETDHRLSDVRISDRCSSNAPDFFDLHYPDSPVTVGTKWTGKVPFPSPGFWAREGVEFDAEFEVVGLQEGRTGRYAHIVCRPARRFTELSVPVAMGWLGFYFDRSGKVTYVKEGYDAHGKVSLGDRVAAINGEAAYTSHARAELLERFVEPISPYLDDRVTVTVLRGAEPIDLELRRRVRDLAEGYIQFSDSHFWIRSTVDVDRGMVLTQEVMAEHTVLIPIRALRPFLEESDEYTGSSKIDRFGSQSTYSRKMSVKWTMRRDS